MEAPSGRRISEAVRGFARRRQRWLIVFAALLVLYTLVGFLVLPWVLRRQLEHRLTAALHRETTIARVRTNPYALSVTIDGFLVKAKDGGPFLSWDRLYVNAALWPVIKRELRVEVVQLVRFHARVFMDRQGRLNFEDLLESNSSNAAPSTTAAAAPESKPPLIFAVDHLDIAQAEMDFSDRSRRHSFDSKIGPFNVKLEKFRARPDWTSPYSFVGTTESGETFSWSGNVLTEPVRSSGTISFDGIRLSKYSPYYEQEVGFEIRDGRLGVKTAYELEWGPKRRLLRTSDGSVAVRSLVLALVGAAQPKVEMPELDVGGIALDVLERTAKVDSVSLRNGIVRARRRSDSQFDLEAMGPPQKSAPRPRTKDERPVQWAVGRVELWGWKVEFDDELPKRPVHLDLAPIEVVLQGLSSKKQQTSKLTATLGWNGRGKVQLDGTVAISRPSADLNVRVDGLDLPSLDPYLALYGDVEARLGDGRLAINGHARYDGTSEPMTWSFDGDTRVESLTLLDTERNQELARWKELRISGIRSTSQPLGVAIQSVRWLEPRVRVAIAPDGSSNLQRILKTPPPAPEGSETTAQVKRPPPPKSDSTQPRISIASFQIVRGAASLADRSVTPPVALGMTEMDVRIRGLSNALKARSQVAVKGMVSGGPLEVSGILSPRMVNDATDIKITSKGIDLTPLSPYCGKYAGYLLEKGKLDLDLQYKVAKRHLEASNLVKIDQFTFGEATNSPDATKLPVKLGLAVLRDKDGLIELDVPVSGDVDDPSFRLGRVIWKAIGNVLVKAAISPFTLLAKAFGGGTERLDTVDFQAGGADLTPTGEKALQGLSKALTSRPALRLDIEGSTDRAADVKSLKTQELRRQAQAAKAKGALRKEKGVVSDKKELTDEEYLRFLQMSYRSVNASAPAATGTGGSADAAPDPAAMEEALLARIELPPETLPALAQNRAEATRARLVALGVDPQRLFLTQGGERAKKEGGARTFFTLK